MYFRNSRMLKRSLLKLLVES